MVTVICEKHVYTASISVAVALHKMYEEGYELYPQSCLALLERPFHFLKVEFPNFEYPHPASTLPFLISAPFGRVHQGEKALCISRVPGMLLKVQLKIFILINFSMIFV